MRTSIPVPFPTSPWEGFVTGGDPARGPVAVGGDLKPATLIGAYRIGLFPWPTSDPAMAQSLNQQYGEAVKRGRIPSLWQTRCPTLDLPWWSPDPRGVIWVTAIRPSRSLRRQLRSCGWTTTLNRCFATVMSRCIRSEINRWITPEMIEAYSCLHTLGYAHSIEVWRDNDLIGGMYGVLNGAVYTGESMFFTQTDASKVALIDFAARLQEAGGKILDTQTISAHLQMMGAIEMPRDQFLAVLNDTRDDEVRLITDRLPVSRLIDQGNKIFEQSINKSSQRSLVDHVNEKADCSKSADESTSRRATQEVLT